MPVAVLGERTVVPDTADLGQCATWRTDRQSPHADARLLDRAGQPHYREGKQLAQATVKQCANGSGLHRHGLRNESHGAVGVLDLEANDICTWCREGARRGWATCVPVDPVSIEIPTLARDGGIGIGGSGKEVDRLPGVGAAG